VSFHSSHGPVKNIEPYTEDTLKLLPEYGHTQIVVVCPAHFCDTVETLEEIGIHGRQTFMNAGGASFRMIEGLNDSEPGIQCLVTLMNSAHKWRPV
jgi:ferrochelatase